MRHVEESTLFQKLYFHFLLFKHVARKFWVRILIEGIKRKNIDSFVCSQEPLPKKAVENHFVTCRAEGKTPFDFFLTCCQRIQDELRYPN